MRRKVELSPLELKILYASLPFKHPSQGEWWLKDGRSTKFDNPHSHSFNLSENEIPKMVKILAHKMVELKGCRKGRVEGFYIPGHYPEIPKLRLALPIIGDTGNETLFAIYRRVAKEEELTLLPKDVGEIVQPINLKWHRRRNTRLAQALGLASLRLPS